MTVHQIAGHGGVRLAVRETGPADAPPLLFLHGWSQAGLAFHRQLANLSDRFRVLAADLRGHGHSDAPTGREAYQESAIWADDVAAILTTLDLDRPILVGWSFGGLVVADHLARHGDAGLAGTVFLGAAIVSGRDWAGTHVGPDFLALAPPMMNPDPAVSLAAVGPFVRACPASPLPEAETDLTVAFNALVRPDVRRALAGRTVDHRPTLARATRPALVVHGAADRILMPKMAEEIAAAHPAARLALYEGVGHMPFAEAEARFAADLDAFATRCRG